MYQYKIKIFFCVLCSVFYVFYFSSAYSLKIFRKGTVGLSYDDNSLVANKHLKQWMIQGEYNANLDFTTYAFLNKLKWEYGSVTDYSKNIDIINPNYQRWETKFFVPNKKNNENGIFINGGEEGDRKFTATRYFAGSGIKEQINKYFYYEFGFETTKELKPVKKSVLSQLKLAFGFNKDIRKDLTLNIENKYLKDFKKNQTADLKGWLEIKLYKYFKLRNEAQWYYTSQTKQWNRRIRTFLVFEF